MLFRSPFGAVIVRVMSPFLSVVPLMSIVVEPSTPPAVSDNPPAGVTTTVSPTDASSSTAPTILLIDTDESEVPSETSTSTDRLYFEDGPWFAAIV